MKYLSLLFIIIFIACKSMCNATFANPILNRMANDIRDNTTASIFSFFEIVHNNDLDLQERDDKGFTLLHHATCKGSIAIMRYLIEMNVPLNDQCNVNNLSPLHCAISKKQYEALKLLISYQADLYLEDKKHRTPLYLATTLNDVAAIIILLQGGADPSHKGTHFKSPMEYAMQKNAFGILDLFQPSPFEPSITPNSKQIQKSSFTLKACSQTFLCIAASCIFAGICFTYEPLKESWF